MNYRKYKDYDGYLQDYSVNARLNRKYHLNIKKYKKYSYGTCNNKSVTKWAL